MGLTNFRGHYKFSTKRSLLKVAFVVPVVIVTITTVILIIKVDLCLTDYQPISAMRKRVLPARDEWQLSQLKEYACDVMLVVRKNFKKQVSGIVYGTQIKTYDCAKVNQTDNNKLWMKDYECMFYAMQTTPKCRGYLFLGKRIIFGAQKIKKVLLNDREKIWQTNRTYHTQGKRHYNLKRKHYRSKILRHIPKRSNETAPCQVAIRELAMLNYGFKVYEERSNRLWKRPWNTEVALNALLWNGKGRYVCFREDVEAFYIPKKHTESFLGLAIIFKKHKLNDDVAIPTILRSLDLKSTFLTI